MEEYVVPEFYDVLVGEGTGTTGGGNVIKATEGFTWGNEGITNSGITANVPEGLIALSYNAFSITVDGNDTVDSVNQKMTDLGLNQAQKFALQVYAMQRSCNA